MPVRFKILQDRRLVVAVGSGEVTYDDLMAHIEELAADPAYTSPMKKLVDYRNATLVTLTPEESIRFTDRKIQLLDTFKNERCVFVAPSDLNFGMSRFHEAHIDGSGIETQVFRTIEEALTWLKVSVTEDELDLG